MQLDIMHEASFDNITVSSHDSDVQADSNIIVSPSISVDVSVPDLEITPPCPDSGARPPSLDRGPSPPKGDNTSRPPAMTPDKTRSFVGEWYSELTKGNNSCGACEEKDNAGYLEHHLVASLNPRLTNLLRKGRFKALHNPEYKDMFVRKVLSSMDHLKDNPFEIITSEPERGYRFTYRFDLDFPELARCDHLTIFYFSKINTQDFVRDYNLKLSPSLQIINTPISETIIENSRIKRKGTVYKNTSNGKLWNGPTNRKGSTSMQAGHHHQYQVDAGGNGSTMEACSPDGICHNHKIIKGVVQPARGATGVHKHAIEDLPILSRLSTTNAKLKNGLSITKSKRIHCDLTPAQGIQSISPSTTRKYIPFFGLSCESPKRLPDMSLSKVARFYFDINIEEILRGTEFGGIFDKQLTDCCKNRIFDLSKILSLEVRRRRVGSYSNRLIRDGEVSQSMAELVAVSGDKSTGMFTPYEFMEQTREVTIEPKKSGCDSRTEEIGVIKEIHMNHMLGVRTFTGMDYDFPEVGEYEYCVLVRIRNGITLFLNENLNELFLMRKKLQKWYELSSDNNYIDKHKNVFTKLYKDLVHCDPQGKVDKDRGDNPYLTIVDNAIILLSNILNCLTDYEHINKNEMVDVLYAMTNAETGNIDGIRNLIEIYDILIGEVEKVLGSKKFRMGEGDLIIKDDTLYKDSNSYGSKAMKDVIEFEKCFDDIHCPCSKSQTWFDFLGVNPNNVTGMKEISPSDYELRTAAEFDKYMGDTGTASLAGGSADDLLVLLASNADPSGTLEKLSARGGFSSFLTPSTVQIGQQKYDLSKINENPEFYSQIYAAYVKSMSKSTATDPLSSGLSFSSELEDTISINILDDTDEAASSDYGIADLSPILGETDAGITSDLFGDTTGCMVPYSAPPTSLDSMFNGCPNPCGDPIKFLKSALTPDEMTSGGTTVDFSPTVTGIDLTSGITAGTPFGPTTTSSSTGGGLSTGGGAGLPTIDTTGTIGPSGTSALGPSGMPPQLLSLLGAPTVETLLKTIPELSGMLLFNYETMAVVEALEYKMTNSGLVKSWIPMTAELNQKAKSKPILCRLRTYSERKWGMRECPEFEFSTCDQYFILGDTSNKKEYCVSPDVQIKNYLIEQQKIYRNVAAGSVKTVNDSIQAVDTQLRLL